MEAASGGQSARLEALSDAVLGFAITLIVVSLEVPASYDELLKALRGLPVFAACFAILIQFWYEHYLFFRRFDLADPLTVALNSFLLFVVLFYVYPLKFLFSAALGGGVAIRVDQVPQLFLIYGIGFSTIFGLLACMYWRALALRTERAYSDLCLLDAKIAIAKFLGYVGVGCISITLAYTVPLRWLGLAGWAYGLMGVVGATVATIGGNRRRELLARGG